MAIKFCTITPEGILPKLIKHPMFEKKSVAFESVMLFCSYLYMRTFYYKDNDATDPYQRIRYDKVRTILGEKYKKYLTVLEELGIINIEKSYIGGNYSKGYKLNAEYLYQKVKIRKIHKRTVQKKKLKLKDHIYQKILRYYPYLKNQLNNFDKIFIDKDLSLNYIYTADDLPEKKKKTHSIIINQIDLDYKYTASVSRSNGRFSSTFTSIPKVLRPFLYTLDIETGEIIFDKVEIDGSNTQPLLLLIKMETTGNKPEPILKEKVLNGKIYDKIASDLKEDRNWVKKKFMTTLLYTPNNSEKTLEYKNPNKSNRETQKFIGYMKTNYPIFYNWLYEIKQQYAKEELTDNWKNPGGSALAIEIQRMESDLWIHGLLPRIPETITYITIHDSIMLFNPQKGEKEFVFNEIRALAKQMYGIEKLPLKIKYFNKEKS